MANTEVKLAKLETNIEYLVTAVKKIEVSLESIGEKLTTLESLKQRVETLEMMIMEDRSNNRKSRDAFNKVVDERIDVMFSERQIILSILKWVGLPGIISLIIAIFILASANGII